MKRKNASGMTLVELMVALTVLTVGLVAILRALPAIYRASARAQSMTVTSMLMSEVQARTKSDHTWGTAASMDILTWQAFTGDFSTTHSWKRDVADVPAGSFISASGAAYLRMMNMSVRYTTGGIDSSINMVTYIANYARMGDDSFGHKP